MLSYWPILSINSHQKFTFFQQRKRAVNRINYIIILESILHVLIVHNFPAPLMMSGI